MAIGITELRILTLLFEREVPRVLLSLSLFQNLKAKFWVFKLRASVSLFVEFLIILNILVYA